MRDVAYWPKTFLDEVEGCPVEQGARLWALGGPSLLYRTPQATIWIDPYFYGTPDDAVPDAYRAVAIPINPEEVRRADLVISTHDHVDHCHGGTLVPITRNTSAMCLGPQSSAKKMREFGIAQERIREVRAGDTAQIGDVQIYVYPGYDPNEPHAVTYVLANGGTKLFVSGDTGDGPALDEVAAAHDLDYALLAFGRTWYMNEAQMLAVARKLRPKTLLPFHWEFWRNHTGDIGKLFEIYYQDRPGFDVKVLLIGDSLSL
jgi:L-ascorbate 6-phosphate lactonase